jgi:magnesium-transporting ATPase (P-type)
MANCKLLLICVRIYKNYKMGEMTVCDVLRGIPGDPGTESIASKYLRRGDFIILRRNQVVPCDCLILDSDDRYISNFVAYFKTNLNDGSTSLNMKKTLNLTKNLKYMDAETNTYQADFQRFRRELCGNIEYSSPTVPWENFEAYVKLNNDPKVEKATIENVARKGAVLMSGLMIAMVLYVNEENRLMNWEKRFNKGKFFPQFPLTLTKVNLGEVLLNPGLMISYSLPLCFIGLSWSAQDF